MGNYRISVQTARWFEEKAPVESIQYIKKCGFEAVDYNINSFFRAGFDEENLTSFFDKSLEELFEYYKPLREVSVVNDVEFGQAHGILVIYHKGEPEKTEYLIQVTEKMIAVCEYLGCKAFVIHPWIGADYGADKEEEIAVNMWLYQRLIPAAKKYGVKICLENLWAKREDEFVDAPCIQVEEACNYIDNLNQIAEEELFGFCLDVGHTQFYHYDICEFIEKLGNRLTVLHLHENDGIVDSHLVPYSLLSSCDKEKMIDWEKILKSLSDISYKGNLSFETCRAIENVPAEVKKMTLEHISRIGKYFKERLQGKSKKGHHLFE